MYPPVWTNVEQLSWEAYATHPLYNQQVKRLIARLRNHLKRQLPDYMLPSTILLLDTLPLTPIGKSGPPCFTCSTVERP